ncbi:MAG: HAD family phosphatase [Pseudomonadota bacterium]
MTQLKAVLFDMDGLLFDTERVNCRAFAATATQHQMTETAAHDLYLEVVGTSFANTMGRVGQAFPGKSMDEFDRDWTARFQDLIATEVPLRPTVAATVRALCDADWPMVVVTSSTRAVALSHLERSGLWPMLKGVVAADDVDRHKPDPEPYVNGAALAGYPPDVCAAFEDSDTGTKAAVAAGCTVWQIPDMRPKDRPLPDLGQGVAETLAEAVADAGLI